MSADRHNSGKARPSLNTPMASKLSARRWTKGAEKYSDWNWKRGFETNEIIDSLERHLIAIKSGEYVDRDWDIDVETKYGLSTHMDGLIVNAEMLIDQYYRNLPDKRPKLPQNYRIGLDIDQVICDTSYHKGDYTNYNDYKFIDAYMCALEYSTTFLSLEPTKEVATMDFEPVVYITARPEFLTSVTEDWLKRNNLPAAPVVHTLDKVSACREHRVDIFVEDNYENFVEINNDGTKCLLMDRPYNRKYDVGFSRIYNLKLSEIL